MNRPDKRSLSGHIDDWEDLAVDYVDGTLSADQAERIEAHLRDCSSCRSRVESQKDLVTMMRSEPMAATPTDLEERVLSLLPETKMLARQAAAGGNALTGGPAGADGRAEIRRRRSPMRTMWWRTLMPVAIAAIFLIAIGGYNLLDQGPATLDSAKVADELATDGENAEALGAGDISTTAAPATSVMEAMETTTTAAGLSSGASEEAVLQTSDLAVASGPVYAELSLAQETQPTTETSTTVGGTPGTDTPSSGQTPAATAAATAEEAQQAARDLFERLTSLTTLDKEYWTDGPVYAAVVDREESEKLVEMLASVGFVVRLLAEPPTEAETAYTRIASTGLVPPTLVGGAGIKKDTPWKSRFTTSTVPESTRVTDRSLYTRHDPDHGGIIFLIR